MARARGRVEGSQRQPPTSARRKEITDPPEYQRPTRPLLAATACSGNVAARYPALAYDDNQSFLSVAMQGARQESNIGAGEAKTTVQRSSAIRCSRQARPFFPHPSIASARCHTLGQVQPPAVTSSLEHGGKVGKTPWGVVWNAEGRKAIVRFVILVDACSRMPLCLLLRSKRRQWREGTAGVWPWT